MKKRMTYLIEQCFLCLFFLNAPFFVFSDPGKDKSAIELKEKNQLAELLLEFKNDTSSKPIIPDDMKDAFNREFTKENIEKFLKEKPYVHQKMDNYTVFLKVLHLIFDKKQNLTDEQIEAIKKIVLSPSKISIVEGVPGSGKTSKVLRWILNYIRGFQDQKKIYLSASNSGGIQSLKKDYGQEIDNKEAVVLDLEQLINPETALEKEAFLLVDECYMMTTVQLQKLLEKAKKYGSKIIFIGDSLQNLPKENHIFGLLNDFPTAQMVTSFRAEKEEQRKFISTYHAKAKEGDSKAMNLALTSLYDARYGYKSINTLVLNQEAFKKDSIELIELKNIFASFKQTASHKETHILAAAKWAKYFLDQKNEKMSVMLIVHESDKEKIKNILKAQGFSDDQIKQVLRTSQESQGDEAAYIGVILNKKMSQAELYVALSRQKKDALIFIPVGEGEDDFKTTQEAIDFPYSSIQKNQVLK